MVASPFFLKPRSKCKRAKETNLPVDQSNRLLDVPTPVNPNLEVPNNDNITLGDNRSSPQSATDSNLTSSHNVRLAVDETHSSTLVQPSPLASRQPSKEPDILPPQIPRQPSPYLDPERLQPGPSIGPNFHALVEDASSRNQYTAQGSINIHHGAVIHQGGTEPVTESYASKVFTWLEALEQNHSHEDARSLYLESTGQWLLDEDCYKKWKYTGEIRALHLNGTVGCGKTILMSTIIDDVLKYCDKQPANTVRPAFFYFDARQRHQCEHLVRSLIRQLSSSQELVPPALDRLWKTTNDGRREISLSEWISCLRGIVQDAGSTCYIILDALDECLDMSSLEKFMDQVGSWMDSGLPLRVMFSSRPLQSIDQMVSAVHPHPIPLTETAVRSDLTIYIQKRLERNLRWSEEQKEEVLSTLLKDANGWFRWVACQLDRVQQCRSSSELKETLESLPPTLDGVYDQVLSSIAERDRVDASRVFQWLIYSKKPLTLTEMWEALAINFDNWMVPFYDPRRRYMNEKDVLDLCPGFLTTIRRSRRDASGNKTTVSLVAFSHYSVQEYLLSEQVTRSPTLSAHFAMNDLVACDFLVRSCELYISHHGQPGQEIPFLSDGFDFRGASAKHHRLLERYPFVDHAAWVIRNHVSEQDGITDLDRPAFLAPAWRRLISELEDEQEKEDIFLAESGQVPENTELRVEGLVFDRVSAAVHAWVRPEWAFRDKEAVTRYAMVPRLSDEDFWRSVYARFGDEQYSSGTRLPNMNAKRMGEAQLASAKEYLQVINSLSGDEQLEALLDFMNESGLDWDDICTRMASARC